ncbi:MAG TPA: S46 family peptidase [Bacteroidia bacterium]|nr:S46 family peptidase [Bacteroidota bacterium]MCB8929807.1 S46 family peptidase [Bacteroidia bacterium]OQB63236.1 MAG: Peptidase S46 [Bacteroidetes bacterium ADurb.Bin141]MCB0850052.1 S46 family peptidase [Bacteroidota bacterium]MCO5289246.1 S46 family peptidase [Bacteroidota bacterium]
MLKKFIFIALLSLQSFNLKADEGMWLPMLLQTVNGDALYTKGLKIPIDSIYSVNKTSLKDAIVLFGGGCTGEIISNKGLLLTNHHCGYSQIQSHSTIEHDYLTNGFWAKNMSEELPCPGLTATFIIRIDDVTDDIINQVNGLKEDDRNKKVKEISEQLIKKAIEGTHYSADIKPFYYGNKYFMIVTETFKDVRMVGAPPSSIGKFGADADNWMWPRHTGDFSIFRIYADKNNQPAEYSKDNVAYTPRYSFPISIKGVKENDFTMVYGFPGRTQEYIPKEAVRTIIENTDPNRIKLRDIRLKIMGEAMRNNDTIRLQYASKYANVENAYKKWQGEVLGLKRLNAIEVKADFETKFVNWTKNVKDGQEYVNALTQLNELHQKIRPYSAALDYYAEGIKGIDLLNFAANFTKLEKLCEKEPVDEKALSDAVDQLKKSSKGFFKNYNASIDKDIFERLIQEYRKGTPQDLAADLSMIDKKFKGDYHKYTEYVFGKSHFSDLAKTEKFLSTFSAKKLKSLTNDPAYQLMKTCSAAYADKVSIPYKSLMNEIDLLQRTYMKGQMEMASDEKRKIYPDANLTLRLTYGKVEGYEPRDGIVYKYYSTLTGVIEKYDSTNYDFNAPAKLLDLYRKKDFGEYGSNGNITPCFLASNHTTGGNSGSPVLNAYGQLIGTNFDRVWEGTMSDIMFDPERCRNISLDIRYTLFIIDKFAGARWLVDEMNIVK